MTSPGYELQFLMVAGWLILLVLLQLAVWPALRPVLKEFAFPVAFPASLLLFTLISWYCGLLHIPVWIAFIPFACLLFWFAYKGCYHRDAFRGQGKWALVFFVFFFFMLELRFINPSISFAEKFMDHAFLASVMRAPVVPPTDPWFLGGTLDVYYYLGYWMFGALGIVAGVPSNIVFNLALPTVLANAAVGMYALAHLFSNRLHWLPLLTFLVVNPSFVWQVIQGKSAGAVLWDSTRTIPDTINEYPAFSFVWGDVHAHVVSICNQVFLLFLLVYALKYWKVLGPKQRLILSFLCALSLGSMPLINTWDVLLYAPVTVLFGLLIWLENRRNGDEGTSGVPGTAGADRESEPTGRFICRPYSFLLFVPFLSLLVYLPYYLQLNTGGIQGIGIVHTPSPVTAFLLVHGLFLLIFLFYLRNDIVRMPLLLLTPFPFVLAGYTAAGIAALPLACFLLKKKKNPAELLAICGLVVIILCEFFYLKDNMGEVYYRMNTIFKFYLPAWILMASSGFAMLAMMLEQPLSGLRVSKGMKTGALLIAVAILLVAPLAIPLEYSYRGATLDGLSWLDTAHPGDAQAVSFLRSLEGQHGLVEAEGGDYTYYSRVSSFTGIPAIIGMPFHEYMWRADGWYGERVNDIRFIYEDPGQTVPLMRKYNATLLYIGETERERYTVRAGESGLPLLYNQSGVQIYTLSA
jgi:YYY domain-containing protein